MVLYPERERYLRYDDKKYMFQETQFDAPSWLRTLGLPIHKHMWNNPSHEKDLEIQQYSDHTQSATPSVIARLRYTFREVKLCKNEVSCVTSHTWRHECHPSWVPLLKTRNNFPSVNFFIYYKIINTGYKYYKTGQCKRKNIFVLFFCPKFYSTR